MDLKALTDDELALHAQAVQVELDRRRLERVLPEQIEQMIASYQDANGLGTGEEWKAPTGAHDAYRQGAIVEHNGKLWESLTPANVWEPGVSGWREKVEEGAGPAEWVQPTGAHDSYKKGDRVRFKGKNYESLMGGNVWSPAAYPAGWKELT